VSKADATVASMVAASSEDAARRRRELPLLDNTDTGATNVNE